MFPSGQHAQSLPALSNGSYAQIISPTNPVHDHATPSPALQPLAFLLGHFYGHGQYVGRSGSFQKEVTGVWEAGGQFIGLRMAVNYPLKDGRNDCHQALVIIGSNPTTQQIESRAYTDGGYVFEHPMELYEGTLRFPDRPPGHAASGRRARKVLIPTPDDQGSQGGYEERLEVEQEDGRFEVYSTLLMRRVVED